MTEMKATKYQKKSQIKLEDLLRRRKSNLKQFLNDRGITTYEGLDALCKRLGVLTPTHASFVECVDKYVSNPTAGVVIINPSPVLVEATGEPELRNDDSFEDLQPQISITDESGETEISVVLREATTITSEKISKKQRRQRRQQQGG